MERLKRVESRLRNACGGWRARGAVTSGAVTARIGLRTYILEGA